MLTDSRDEDDLAGELEPRLEERLRVLRPHSGERGSFVLYWMRTAARGHENPALDTALSASRRLGIPIFVYHALSERYPFASDRHHRFILEGASDVQRELRDRGIGYGFHLERPEHRGPALRTLAERAALVVTEDFPTPPIRRLTEGLLRSSEAPVWAVDTACVLPMRLSGGRPDRAYAFRDATRAARDTRLALDWIETPSVTEAFVPTELPFEPVDFASASLDDLIASCDIDHGVAPVPETRGGSVAGYARWQTFLAGGLEQYRSRRNDPTIDGTSRLSAYLHYGHVSPLRIAREASRYRSEGARKFLDELLVWREMAYTWCLHEDEPESVSALPDRARETLAQHAEDERAPLSWERLARGRTGDPLWDLMQRSLLVHGELHNNVRMTWAKAIPYWSANLPTALSRMIDLNHRYALDGRDPASYGGLLWSLGLFDRPLPSRSEVLGSVRSRLTQRHAERLDMLAYRAHVLRPRRRPPPTVAVIGAGIAGLACARTLHDHGLNVTVFDKGRAPGGRMCSRRMDAGRIDHGAQFFRARGESLARFVESWAEDGVVHAWHARFLEPDGSGGLCETSDTEARWVATPTMRALSRHLADGLKIQSEVRIVSIAHTGCGWTLNDGESTHGPFDRLVLGMPSPQTAELLDEHPWVSALTSVRIAPCLAVGARLPRGVDLGFDAARLDDGSALSWVAREGSKPGRSDDGWWILHASPDWSRAHLEDETNAVVEAMVSTFRSKFSAPAPEATFGHRWRYALVEEPLGESCLFDPERGLAVCGDGCLGGRVEAAWSSGIAAARRLLGEEMEPSRAIEHAASSPHQVV